MSSFLTLPKEKALRLFNKTLFCALVMLCALLSGATRSFATGTRYQVTASSSAPSGTTSYCQGAATSSYTDIANQTSCSGTSTSNIITWQWVYDGTNAISGASGTFDISSVDPPTVTLTAAQSAVLSTLSPGVHTLQCRYSKGQSFCTDASPVFSPALNITINALPTAVTVTGGGAVCGSTTLTASGGTGGTIYYQGTTSNGTSTATASSSQAISSAGTYYFRSRSAAGCWGTQGSAAVTINPAAGAVTASGGGSFCGSTTITATGGSGGTIYFQGTTSGGTSTATASASESVSASGTYYFRARTAAGCWGPEGSVTVTISPVPGAVSVTGGGAVCGSTTLLASGGSGGTIYYEGNTSGGLSVATPSSSQFISSAGTYYFRARSAAGCWGNEGAATVTINTPPAAVVAGTSGAYCGNTTIAAGNGSDGTIYFQGTTSGGTSTATPATVQVVASSGTYYFRAQSSAGCWGTEAGVAVTINAAPAAVVVSGGGTYCGSTTITAANGGDGTMYFQGTTSGGTSTATASASQLVTSSGTYYFRARSAAGCWGPEGSVAVTINALPATATVSGAGSFCVSTTITAANGGDGTMYFQGTASGATSIATPSFAETITSSGTYYFRARSAAGCWGAEGSAAVTINNAPAAVTASGSGTYCGSTTITAANGGDGTIYFQGTTSGGTSTATAAASQVVTSSGTYYFRARSAAGCWGAEGSVAVTINALPATVTASGAGTFCQQATIAAANGGDGTIYYQGTTSGATSTASLSSSQVVTSSGTYYFRAQSALGCWSQEGSVAVVVNALPAAVTATGGGTFCGQTTIAAANGGDGTIYYQGTTSGGTATGTPSSSQLITGTGVYYFRAQSAQGCWSPEGNVAVTINPIPAAVMVAGAGTYCENATITADNGGDGTMYYQGATSGGTSTIAPAASQLVAASGTYYFRTRSADGCWSPEGSAAVVINQLPATVTVSGAGTYCDNATITATNGGDGTIYFQGNTSGGTFTDNATSSQVVTSSGTYYFRAMSVDGCWGAEGSVTVTVNPLPAAVVTSGDGIYCESATVTAMNGGDGTMYFQGSTSGGTSVTLPSVSQVLTSSGTYYFRAQSALGCWSPEGSVSVTINSLPAAVTVTGGGTYCNSATLTAGNGGDGTIYFQGVTSGGFSAAIPSAAESVTATGTYYFRARSSAGCWGAQGSAAVTVNPLPDVSNFSITATSPCNGSSSVVTLNSSSLGNAAFTVAYDLAGANISSGHTASVTMASATGGITIPAASLTVSGSTSIAITAITNSFGCIAVPSGNTASYVVNALPATVTVSGGGIHCGGATLLGTNGNDGVIFYQGTVASGTSVANPVVSSDVTATGTYYFRARSAQGCWGAQGSAAVTVNPYPAIRTVSGGGHYCFGGAGRHISLNGSASGINYQLYTSAGPVGGLVSGTGGILDMGAQLAENIYSVSATDMVSGCTDSMTGSAEIVIDTLPLVRNVAGGGAYCQGGSGVHVSVDGSDAGINYQLYRNGVASGSAQPGIDDVLDFGPQLLAGIYTVVATDGITACASNMAGSAEIIVNPNPVVRTITGGGAYCAGGSGFALSLSGSEANVAYQLYNGTDAVGTPFTGSGPAIALGTYTAAGVYTVAAANMVTSCTSNMAGASTIVINALPEVRAVTGGGSYCAGGTGMVVGLDNSYTGINYKIYRGATLTGTQAGNGTPLTFGPYTLAGTYTVVAVNAATLCSSNMSGSASITINPLLTPAISMVSGSGTDICAGTDVAYTTSTVNAGLAPVYQWRVNGAVMAGATSAAYNYIPAHNDVITVKLLSNAVCATPDSATAAITMTVHENMMPAVTITADPGNTICQSETAHLSATGVNGGPGATYMWHRNGAYVSSGTAMSYVPADGDVIFCKLSSDYRCRLADTVASSNINITVNPVFVPAVGIEFRPASRAGEADSVVAVVANAGPIPSYQWQLNGNDIADATSAWYASSTFANNDFVTCTVIGSGACGLRSFNTAYITKAATGITLTATPTGNITLSPNPNKGLFAVKGSFAATDDEATIEVIDVMGHVVYKEKVTTRDGKIDMHIQLGTTIANGMYLLNVRTAAASRQIPFVVSQ